MFLSVCKHNGVITLEHHTLETHNHDLVSLYFYLLYFVGVPRIIK